MRITIMALGSQGDVQPYVALGCALQQCGHDVLVTSFENFESLITGQGLDFHPVKGDAQALLNSMGGQALAQSGKNPIAATFNSLKVFGSIADNYIEAFSADILMDSEAIINQLPLSLFGIDLAEKLQVPYIIASVIPLMPTSAWAMPLVRPLPFGRLTNWFTYRAPEQAGWQFFRRAINRYRNLLDLPPAPFWGNSRRIREQRIPVINGFSPEVVPPPPDWDNHIHTTGYWQLPEPDWDPDVALLNFLDAGPAPVFIGFGSMSLADPAGMTDLLLEALNRSGQRGILHMGWAGLADRDLPDTVYKIDYAPYHWLFPRMAAVVHHGGSGTTGLALSSGRPSLVVPFAVDQYFWGARTTALGVGPPPVPRNQLTANKLAAAFQTMTTHQPMQERAAELGEKLQAEDGLTPAVQLIERYLKSTLN